MKATDSFCAAMRSAGLHYAGQIIADGKLHRFKVDGDKERNSWFILFHGPPQAGAFGCWKRDIKENWCERNGQTLSPDEWQRVRGQWQRADVERKQVEVEHHAEARAEAARILKDAKPPHGHAYLERKGVKAFGEARQQGGSLVLPLRVADGTLHSLQFITADGTKRFLTGGRVAGCYFTVCAKSDGPLVLCEGYATGASIHEATSLATICAMNCGNLKAVAEALRAKWPARDMIIAADNDAFTTGNPGITTATEAAKAIGAKLAVPQFTDTGSKPTDFNDLHQLQGLDTVKTQIESATTPKESDDDIIARLAALPPLEYERQRENAAHELGCRAGTLDKLVDAKRPSSTTADGELQGRTMNLADVEPWPESVCGADVLSQVAATFARFVALPDGAADALALWAAHAHTFSSFICSPRLNISSPEKGCGKSTLRDVLAVLVPRPLLAENLSVAVLFRVTQAHHPTLLADECDSWLGDNDELRGMLNSGHRRGGQALRCEGDSNEVRAFNVFAPAVLCGIGALPGTLHDRSIVIRLERAKPGELSERFDSRRVDPEKELCRKLARFCADNTARLEACDPALPHGAFNRLADNWRPLFAVAELAGGDWPARAAAAFAKLTSGEDTDAQGLGVMLLADIRQVFTQNHGDRIFSKTLVESLLSITDRPWTEAHRGRPITEVWLSRRLHSFGIAPRTLRIGNARAKGYERADFTDTFLRYLPDKGEPSRDTVTSIDFTGVRATSGNVTTQQPVTDANTEETREKTGVSRCHGSNPPVAEEEPDEVMLL